jgi:hypothetical protein
MPNASGVTTVNPAQRIVQSVVEPIVNPPMFELSSREEPRVF